MNNSNLIRPNGLPSSVPPSGASVPPPRATSKKTTLLPRFMASITAGSGPDFCIVGIALNVENSPVLDVVCVVCGWSAGGRSVVR